LTVPGRAFEAGEDDGVVREEVTRVTDGRPGLLALTEVGDDSRGFNADGGVAGGGPGEGGSAEVVTEIVAPVLGVVVGSTSGVGEGAGDVGGGGVETGEAGGVETDEEVEVAVFHDGEERPRSESDGVEVERERFKG